MVLKKGPRKGTRNPVLVQGVRRYGRAQLSHKTQKWRKAKLGPNGKKTPKKVKTVVAVEPRFYAADDKRVPLRSNKVNRPTKLRKSITAGTVVIILAGRFRGKRVIVLKQLQPSGLLLVTGPYKLNGVPLRRVNQSYVIATSTKVDVSSVDVKAIDDKFFARSAAKKSAKGKEEFFENKEKKQKSHRREKMPPRKLMLP